MLNDWTQVPANKRRAAGGPARNHPNVLFKAYGMRNEATALALNAGAAYVCAMRAVRAMRAMRAAHAPNDSKG
jgi:hypothetical protein